MGHLQKIELGSIFYTFCSHVFAFHHAKQYYKMTFTFDININKSNDLRLIILTQIDTGAATINRLIDNRSNRA